MIVQRALDDDSWRNDAQFCKFYSHNAFSVWRSNQQSLDLQNSMARCFDRYRISPVFLFDYFTLHKCPAIYIYQIQPPVSMKSTNYPQLCISTFALFLLLSTFPSKKSREEKAQQETEIKSKFNQLCEPIKKCS